MTTNVKDILDLMDSPSKERIKRITKAYDFAKKAHTGQKRSEGEPFFTHLFETAKILAELGMGSRTITAGLLHDTIEDTDVTEEIIKKEFGSEILFLVQGVTKLGKLKYRGVQRHAESLRKLFAATAEDVRVIIIKLADRLHNMQTLHFDSKEKEKRIALETLEIYAPIANRFGIGHIKNELEDLAFPYVYPEEYEKVKKLRKQKRRETIRRLEKINKSLKKELARNGMIDIKTDYRLKPLYSLYKKLKQKEWDIEKAYDISAIRIIVPTVSDCYKTLGIIHGVWRPLPGKIKDYIESPIADGYRSLHTTIFTGDGGLVEIQIRTREMHQISETSSHILYKEEKLNKKQGDRRSIAWIRRFLTSKIKTRIKNTKKLKKSESENQKIYTIPNAPKWIKQMVEEQENTQGSEEFLDDLKTDFFNDRVFIFTPKGDVIDLPIDSSPVDFAYAIHSDIGNHIFGAKVNGKLVHINAKLENDDVVEIITRKSSHPTQKWLDFVKTTFAQRHIRNFLQKD